MLQLPWLALLYTCRTTRQSDGQNSDLPPHYRRLLLLVALTWLTFPVWWLLSSEGMSIITDTKMNGFGFTFLNILSKSSFTFHMAHMARLHLSSLRRSSVDEVSQPTHITPWYVAVLNQYDSEQIGWGSEGSNQSSTPSDVAELQSSSPLPILKTGAENSDAWLLLDKDYQCYLLAAGISQAEFGSISSETKLRMRLAYTGQAPSMGGLVRKDGNLSVQGSDLRMPTPASSDVSTEDSLYPLTESNCHRRLHADDDPLYSV
jgi:hypothetical protein